MSVSLILPVPKPNNFKINLKDIMTGKSKGLEKEKPFDKDIKGNC